MVQLDPQALRQLEGQTIYVGGEPIRFEQATTRPGTAQGRVLTVVPFCAGKEAIVAWVTYKGRRHALKLMRRPTPVRRQRIDFLLGLRLHGWGVPAFSAAPRLGLEGPIQLKGEERPIDLVGYLADYISGRSLMELMRGTSAEWDQISLAARFKIAAQLAGAVQILERSHIAHGDLHPANILITDATSQDPQLRLIDFDAFHHPSEAWAPPVSKQEGRVVGAEGYIHPTAFKEEQVRSDRMSLAVLCCEIVALRTQHMQKRRRNGLFRQPELCARKDQLPDEIRELWPEGFRLLDQTLSAERYEVEGASPGEWLNALSALLDAPVPDLRGRPCAGLHLQVYLPGKTVPVQIPVSVSGTTFAAASPELGWLRLEMVPGNPGRAPSLRVTGNEVWPALFRRRNQELRSQIKEVCFDAQVGDLFEWKQYKILVAT